MPKIQELADIKSSYIREGTRVCQFCVVHESAKIGKGCNLLAHTLVEGDVFVSDDVTLKLGVYLWGGTRIKDNVYIGHNATFTNDSIPRWVVYPGKFESVTIKMSASIGANVTTLPSVIIGRSAMVGAGAVATKDVPDLSVVVGNPAKIIRYLTV